MGVVYEGRDPNLDRRVAIKTVKVENLSEEAASEYEHRFRTEARSAARLQHPNIVSVYDSDRDTDVAFLVMEYIQGDDLKHHLDRGVRYSLEQSLKIIRDLLSALDYAHKQGIVHRDIKPANLLIEPGGRVKLTDFGVARIQDSGVATRTQGSMVGTLKYMAPEQVQGQKIDSRADLFSAGVLLYQLLTDKRPFDGDNDFSIIHQIIGHHPPPPSSIHPKLPAALDAVVARALAKTREERFATARDFAVALQAATRRAEDQTVVPPANPNKKVEGSASRPLTAPEALPSGAETTPSVGGGSGTSVTQELELVYWKDVKDSSDAEDLQGFLEKFPAGIYADLARRRLRKLSGGDQTLLSQPGLSTGSTFAATQFPDDIEATRLRTDASRPAVGGGTDLRPVHWVDEDYTKTLAQPSDADASRPGLSTGTIPLAGSGVERRDASPAPASAAASEAAAVAAEALAGPGGTAAPAATAAQELPVTAGPAAVPAVAALVSRRVSSDDDDDDDDDEDSVPPAPARRKAPMAVLAGVGLLAVAGVLVMVMGRSKGVDPAAKQVAVSAPANGAAAKAAAAAPPAAGYATAPAAAPAAVAAPPNAPAATAAAPVAVPESAPKTHIASAPPARKPATTAKAAAPVQEPLRNTAAMTPARGDPDVAPTRPAPPPVASTSAGYHAVDQCRDRVFLMLELCLAEHCGKQGARSHPLCVRYREEVRLREDARQQMR